MFGLILVVWCVAFFVCFLQSREGMHSLESNFVLITFLLHSKPLIQDYLVLQEGVKMHSVNMHLFHFFPRQNSEFVFNPKLLQFCYFSPFSLGAFLIVYSLNYFSSETRDVTLGCYLDSISWSCRKPPLKLRIAKPFPLRKCLLIWKSHFKRCRMH